MDDVASEINTMESVAHWCKVNLPTGRLSVTLEVNRCFDAEVYVDDTDLPDKSRFKEDQRINLGKWVLRWLFSPLIEEEVKRDAAFIASLSSTSDSNTPTPTAASLGMPIPMPHNHRTLRPGDGHYSSFTQGHGIGVATPGAESSLNTSSAASALTGEDTRSDLSSLHPEGQRTPYSDKGNNNDYFSSKPVPAATASDGGGGDKATGPGTPGGGGGGGGVEAPSTPTTEPDKEEKKKTGSFLGVKKFRMEFPKKLSRATGDTNKAPAQPEEKAVEESDKSSAKEERVFEPNLGGFMERTRHVYDEFVAANPGRDVESWLKPSSEADTPYLSIPPQTTVYIQEESVDSAVAHDLYGGSVNDMKRETDKLEKSVPLWLAEFLLRVSQ